MRKWRRTGDFDRLLRSEPSILDAEANAGTNLPISGDRCTRQSRPRAVRRRRFSRKSISLLERLLKNEGVFASEMSADIIDGMLRAEGNEIPVEDYHRRISNMMIAIDERVICACN
jgi:hypothetical protein